MAQVAAVAHPGDGEDGEHEPGEFVHEDARRVGLRVEPDEDAEADADEGGAELTAMDDHVDADQDEQGVDGDVVLLPVPVAEDVQAAAVNHEVVEQVRGSARDGGPALRHDRPRAGTSLQFGEHEHDRRGADVPEVLVPVARQHAGDDAQERAHERVRGAQQPPLERPTREGPRAGVALGSVEGGARRAHQAAGATAVGSHLEEMRARARRPRE